MKVTRLPSFSQLLIAGFNGSAKSRARNAHVAERHQPTLHRIPTRRGTMLVRNGVTVGLIVVALGSTAVSRPASAQNGSNGNFGATTGMFRQAPNGHRQPRPIDIPVVEPSPSALRQEDESIDRKLNICRG